MNKLDIIKLCIELLGALVSFAALIISALALRIAHRVSSLKDRPIIYIQPSGRYFPFPGSPGTISNEDLLSKGLPLNDITVFQQEFSVKNGSQILAQKLKIFSKLRFGSKEKDLPEKYLDFCPPEQIGSIVCEVDQEIMNELKKGIPLVVYFKTTYQDNYEHTFETEQFFRFDLLMYKESFRGVQINVIAKKYWDLSAGNSIKIGCSPKLEMINGAKFINLPPK